MIDRQTLRQFRYQAKGFLVLGSLALGFWTPYAFSTPTAIFEEVGVATAKTQSFLQQHQLQTALPYLPGPLESLKRDNMRQLDYKAGMLFGRFYDERALLNTPPTHAATHTSDTTHKAASGMGQPSEASAVDFLEKAQPERNTPSPSTQLQTPTDQKIQSTVVSPQLSQAEKMVNPDSSIDARAVATPRKHSGFKVPRWVKRLQKIDDPVNELQLFVPKP